jgi:SAM-dependent methyltransferase
MSAVARHDSWTDGQSYEHYMGRWSRRIAEKFIEWVDPPSDAAWLEVGCGTGALTAAILASAAPRSLLATDLSDGFVGHSRDANRDPRVRFQVADATDLPCADTSVDIVTSGLVLNFVPDKQKAFAEMRRVLRPGGTVAFYVWDYPGGGMGFIDAFWKAAAEIDPGAADLDEGPRFPYCVEDGLAALCRAAGIADPEIAVLEIETVFADFDAFWQPFTLGVGPAPGYAATLSGPRRSQLKARLAERLGTNGPISLPARAWAVKAGWPADR